MEKKLLLLGLLRNQETYGYQLNELIDAHMGISIHLKKPTMYALLKKMTDDGWATSREEREGNRPPRRVYVITDKGEASFQQMLRESLASYTPTEELGDISLAFLDAMPPSEALELLKSRQSLMKDAGEMYLAHADHSITSHEGTEHHGHDNVLSGSDLNGHHLVFEHQQHHFDSELQWLDQLISRVEAAAKEENK